MEVSLSDDVMLRLADECQKSYCLHIHLILAALSTLHSDDEVHMNIY